MINLAHPVTRLYPTLAKEGLGWRTVAPGIVEIRVDLANHGHEPTPPADLNIEAAVLGAFVPSMPVARVAVGFLDPGERRRVLVRVDRSILDVLAKCYHGIGRDTLDLMAQSEWAGNLNVWFDRDQPVELHQALMLRVPAGRPVALHFFTAERTTCAVRVSDRLWRAIVDGLDSGGMLIVEPPQTAGLSAEVTVDVTRKSDGKVVPVEFSFVTV